MSLWFSYREDTAQLESGQLIGVRRDGQIGLAHADSTGAITVQLQEADDQGRTELLYRSGQMMLDSGWLIAA